MSSPNPAWQEAMQKIYQRAATDAAFRRRCLEDARAVFREISGTEAPADFKIRFVEDRSETLFVLPPFRAGEELADFELADVAGGAGGPSATCDWYMNIPTCNASGPQITYDY
jgi:hypothetical protein